MQARQFVLYPPPRVRYTQWNDGSIHIHVNPEQAAKLADALTLVAQQLREYVVASLEHVKASEESRLVPPPSRIQMLEAELERARAEASRPVAVALANALQTYNQGPTNPVPDHILKLRNKGAQIEAQAMYGQQPVEEITPTTVIGHAETDDGSLGPPPAKI